MHYYAYADVCSLFYIFYIILFFNPNILSFYFWNYLHQS